MYTALLLLVLAISSSDGLRSKRQIVFPEGEEAPVETEGPRCATPDRRRGVCVRITSCPALLRIRNNNRLRRFFCGYEGQEPKVCCPSEGGPATTTLRPRVLPTRAPITRRPTRRPTTRPPPVRETGGRPSFLPRDCGLTNYTKTRVVGGREAERGSWPWMAVVYQEKRGVKSPDCGGALVTQLHVITAAHCVVGRRTATLDPNVLSVRLGEHDLYSDEDGMQPVEVNVESVTRHADFDSRTYKNDIAVLRLARPVAFSDFISPICLPFDSLLDMDLTSKRSFVAGWGTTSFNGPSSPVLMEVGFDIQDQEFCRKAYEKELPITEVYICAGTADGSKDSCQGDSGGPLMTIGKENRYYLVGIVSFGKLCAQPGYPGVYTRVTKYLDWLRTALAS